MVKRLITVMVMALFIVAVPSAGRVAEADEPTPVPADTQQDNSEGYWSATYEGARSAQEDRDMGESGLNIPDAWTYLMSETSRSGCVYETKGDNPHYSRGDVSAHGWWLRRSNECPARADVRVFLYGRWCEDGECEWRYLASNGGRIRPGGGRGNRVTVRNKCYTNEPTYYRSVVDVDILGQIDPPDQVENINQVRCRPPGPGYEE